MKQFKFMVAFISFALIPVAALLAAGSGASLIRVKVEIDYGSQGKPPVKKSVLLKPGSTVVDATQAVADLKQGFVCCDPKDVETIGGVKCDAEKEGWWLYDINGEKGQVSAYRCLLMDGDRVTWRYRETGSLRRIKTGSYRETSAGAGNLEGTVGVDGDVPFLPPYKVHKNKDYCGDTDLKANPCERTHAKGKLSGVVVWLGGVTQGKAWEKLKTPTLTQRACQFVPHLIVAPRGSTLKILSEDSVLHSVHAADEEHRTLFNLAMPDSSSRNQVTLSDNGVWDIQCDAGHRWMKAHLIVVDNPYWTLTAKDGSYRLEGIPPGDYTLNIWSDLYGLDSRKITVTAGVQTVSTIFPQEKFRMDMRYVDVK